MKIRPTTGRKREHPIALKAGDVELAVLETAAQLCDMNLSLFIMNAALMHACEVCSINKKFDDIVSKVEPLIIKED